MANSLFSLHAYVKNGTWMFDDEGRDIKEEPFVAGADILFDLMSGREADPSVKSCDIVFGATPIPDHDVHVKLVGDDGHNGHYYTVEYFGMYRAVETFEFWLCPALLAFFDSAPEDIFVSIAS
jgi:hypothetical protein